MSSDIPFLDYAGGFVVLTVLAILIMSIPLMVLNSLDADDDSKKAWLEQCVLTGRDISTCNGLWGMVRTPEFFSAYENTRPSLPPEDM